ncbi:MAG: hypothetical protein SynsKO_15930 [Synoicihabitans sp.]
MALLLFFGGCASAPAVRSIPESVAPTPAQVGGIDAAQHAVITIVSDPGDAMVVINRQPLGLTPQRLKVPVTEQGFLAEPVTIAVRFVARDVTEASMTTDITLHPTDRAPQRLVFTREKARRVFGE